MTRTAPRTLTQMQNLPTSYEVAVTEANGNETRLGFTERTTKGTLLNMVCSNGQFILTLLGDWDEDWTYSKATGVTLGPVRVHFTGRTERDIASAANLI